MVKKAVKLFCLMLAAMFVLSACAPSKPEQPSDDENTVKTVEGVIKDASMNTAEIQGENDALYIFSLTDAEVVTNSHAMLLGAGVRITYVGTLNADEPVQNVKVQKLEIIHASSLEETQPPEEIQPPEETTAAPVTQPAETPPQPEGSKSIDEIISSMTLEEKVGQMFMARCPESDAVQMVKQYSLGGYILFARDFKNQTKASAKNKINSYQSASNVPMFIGVDEEGGTVNRVSIYKDFRAVPFWSPQALYKHGGMDLIASNAEEKAKLLTSLGVNVNFAPVCDISTDSSDFIYKRSFGKSPQETSQFVTTVVDTYNQNKLGAVLKHFPGYGNNIDTHTDVAHDDRSLESFRNSDFLPFEAGIAAGAPCILVSHNIVSAVDASSPASLSAPMHDILRNELKFNGVIITDDLAMAAVTKYAGDSAAAVLAVKAGNDMLICTNFTQQIPGVIDAVKSGEISQSTIDGCVKRILTWKQSLGLI